MNKEQAYLYDKAMRIKFYQEQNTPFYKIKESYRLDCRNNIDEYPRELRPNSIPHKMQFSETVKRAFTVIRTWNNQQYADRASGRREIINNIVKGIEKLAGEDKNQKL